MKRRRPFILLELLLAIALLLSAFFPLLKMHSALKVARVKKIEMLEFERLSDLAFMEFKTDIFEKKELSFAQVQKGISGHLSPLQGHFKSYAAQFTIRKPIRKKEGYCMTQVTITLNRDNKELFKKSYPITFAKR